MKLFRKKRIPPPEYAKISAVKAGTKLKADGGFTCIKEDTVRIVIADGHGDLYIGCREGRHYLAGQVERDHYIGLFIVT